VSGRREFFHTFRNFFKLQTNCQVLHTRVVGFGFFLVRLLGFGVAAVGAPAPRVVWDVSGVQLFIRNLTV
jgi:hypothetical protein